LRGGDLRFDQNDMIRIIPHIWTVLRGHNLAIRHASHAPGRVTDNQVLRRILGMVMRLHEHEAERVLARQLDLSGGKMTDELERQVMEIIMRNRLYSR
jgi:hypothetical protein